MYKCVPNGHFSVGTLQLGENKIFCSYVLIHVSAYFFPRGHGNESCNLIGSYRGPDFPISDHGHGNAFVYRSELAVDSTSTIVTLN